MKRIIKGKIGLVRKKVKNIKLVVAKFFKGIANSNLILDIDLDYFTYAKDDKVHILSPDNFNHIFNNIGYDSIFYLLEKTDVITIALEPNYCGGIDNCSKILQLLVNEYF